MWELITHSVAAIIGGVVTLYTVKNNPGLLEKWIEKIKEKANKL